MQVVTRTVGSLPGEPHIHPILNTARVAAVGEEKMGKYKNKLYLAH